MRLRHPDGSLLHLAYCSNVHPADDLDGVSAQLERYTARVRERLDVPVLGIGLWVAAPALADAAAADAPRASSSTGCRLEVVTLNGFPYKAFHAPVVKRDVYWPHWAQDDAARVHARASRGCSPAAARRTSRRAASRRCRSGGARAGTTPAQAAALRALADLAGELEALHARDRQAHPARAGARAGVHGRDDRPGRATRSPGSRRSGSASAWTPAISRCSSRSRVGGGRARCGDVGRADRQDAGLERAARGRPVVGGGSRAARALRRAAVPAPGARARELARRGHGRPARGAGRRAARRATSGACTSTCRSTRAEHTTQDELGDDAGRARRRCVRR